MNSEPFGGPSRRIPSFQASTAITPPAKTTNTSCNQTAPRSCALGSASPPYDGFAEIQFASADDLERRLYLSAEGKAAIERDVGRFLGTIHAYYVAEHVARWIEHVPGRFSIRVGDAEAFLVYERRDDVLDVLHTYTPPALRGGNLAAELTRAALDHARAEGLRVVPTCSYTRRYLARHPAYNFD